MYDSTVNLKHGGAPLPENSAPRPRRRGMFARLFAALVIAIVIIYAVMWAWSAIGATFAWKAVFLTNDQVYFGHFYKMPFSDTITLSDVYYLQLTQPSQQLSGETQSQLKLVKLGNEIHGPTSEMVIPVSQIRFWETLRSDSAIVKTIQNGQVQTNQ